MRRRIRKWWRRWIRASQPAAAPPKPALPAHDEWLAALLNELADPDTEAAFQRADVLYILEHRRSIARRIGLNPNRRPRHD